MSNNNKDFSVCTFAEARTGGRQLIQFTCRPEDVKKIKEFLKLIEKIEIPTTRRTLVSHGGYGRWSRFEIVQHRYAGGGYLGDGGYIEVLEIKNPPDGRHGVVVHQFNWLEGSIFVEFKTLEDALVAFENWPFDLPISKKEVSELKGFIRMVVCGAFTPWFYAVGDQHLVGDFVFPDIVIEDPEFRFGRKFIVEDYDGLPIIKTCVGVRWVRPHWSNKEVRRVYFDDGSFWEEGSSWSVPVPLTEKYLWFQKAVEEFRKLLLKKTGKFTIEFFTGHKFVGKLTRTKNGLGNYKARVKIRTENGKVKTREGFFEFIPTADCSSIEEFINQKFKERGCEVLDIEAVVRITKKGSQILFKLE